MNVAKKIISEIIAKIVEDQFVVNVKYHIL